MDRTEDLILRLVGELTPVRRLRPPAVRAALWLAAVAAFSTALIFGFGHVDIFSGRAADPKLVLEIFGIILTAVPAIIAAFALSLPDRPARWALLPLPGLLLWLASSGYSCWRHWISYEPEGWRVGESAECFLWIVIVGLSLGLALMWALRRVRPLAPLLPAATGGLGVAAIAAFLLQFFHAFDVTFMDLGLHAAGVIAVVTVMGLSRGAICCSFWGR